jgi:hypothetical protein
MGASYNDLGQALGSGVDENAVLHIDEAAKRRIQHVALPPKHWTRVKDVFRARESGVAPGVGRARGERQRESSHRSFFLFGLSGDGRSEGENREREGVGLWAISRPVPAPGVDGRVLQAVSRSHCDSRERHDSTFFITSYRYPRRR